MDLYSSEVGRVEGAFFGCTDPREELENKVICLGANLFCKPMPGVDFGEPLKLLDYWRQYAHPEWVAIFGPHKDCRWHPSDAVAAMHALNYAEYFHNNGVPSACILLGDKTPEVLLNRLDGHPIEERLLRLFEKTGWGLMHGAYAEAVHIGQHFKSMRWPRALRLSSPFITDEIVSRMGEVLNTFRRDQILPVRFSEEVSHDERQRLVGLFMSHNLPVVA